MLLQICKILPWQNTRFNLREMNMKIFQDEWFQPNLLLCDNALSVFHGNNDISWLFKYLINMPMAQNNSFALII